MASSVVLRKAASLNLTSRLFNSLRASSMAPSSTRSFNTNAQLANHDDEDRSADVDRRSNRRLSRRRNPGFFSDVMDPFSPPMSLNQALNMMNQFIENPYRAMEGPGARRSWDAREDEKGMYLRMDMPGLDKGDVKVTVEQNTLVIKGEGKEEQSQRQYSSRLELPPNVYKVDQIKAEMKNGVLKVVVPKVQEEEKRNVHQIQVD